MPNAMAMKPSTSAEEEFALKYLRDRGIDVDAGREGILSAMRTMTLPWSERVVRPMDNQFNAMDSKGRDPLGVWADRYDMEQFEKQLQDMAKRLRPEPTMPSGGWAPTVERAR